MQGAKSKDRQHFIAGTTMLTYQGWITNMEKEAPDAVQPLPSP